MGKLKPGVLRSLELYTPEETPEFLEVRAKWRSILGEFIEEFAQTEHHLRRLLMRHAGVTEAIGRALFQSGRIAEMKDSINRILDATGNDKAKAGLDPFFAQLSVISSVRNNIMHWGGYQLSSGEFLVTNLHMAPVEKGRGHRVSAADLEDMLWDLSTISAAFIIARQRVKLSGKFRFPVPYPAPKTWRYKPRALPPLGRTPRQPKPPKQGNPPPPSRGKSRSQ